MIANCVFGRHTLLLAGCLLLLAGCRQDMHDQPKSQPLEASRFFADQQASRSLIPGTVPRGWLREDEAFHRGLSADGQFVVDLPVESTRDLLERGQERFDIFCSPCHGRTGDGNGMIVQRGFKRPESFHQDRLRAMPVGYFFDVVTNGFGQMSSYASQVPVLDRCAITAYLGRRASRCRSATTRSTQ
jgi:hypothetical protein